MKNTVDGTRLKMLGNRWEKRRLSAARAWDRHGPGKVSGAEMSKFDKAERLLVSEALRLARSLGVQMEGHVRRKETA